MLPALGLAVLMNFAPVPYTPDVPHNPPLVRDYLALCDQDAKACSDVLFDHIWASSVGPQHVSYCVPESGMSEAEITAKAVAWLKANPKLALSPTKPALTRAMTASFPCGRR